jgi:hypothetical protein
MDEQWTLEQEQERAWAQSLADDPTWIEWNEQLNQQHYHAHQQEQDDDRHQLAQF